VSPDSSGFREKYAIEAFRQDKPDYSQDEWAREVNRKRKYYESDVESSIEILNGWQNIYGRESRLLVL